MFSWLIFGLPLALALVKSRRHLLLENAALRHQLLVLRRKTKRTRFHSVDRLFWTWLSAVWGRWTRAMQLAQPATVIRWHRNCFRRFWRWKSRTGKIGRKSLAPETIELIRQICPANTP